MAYSEPENTCAPGTGETSGQGDFCCEALSPDASLAKDRVRTVAGKNSLRLNTSKADREERGGGRKIHVNPASPGNVIQGK